MDWSEEHIEVNTVDTDYRAETLAAGLIKNGLDDSKLHIIRRKGNTKWVSKDIDKIEKEKGYIDSGFDIIEYLSIYTNRDGIYDSLPEGIFHQTTNNGKQKSKEAIIQEIKDHREEEFFARHFFQPFEMILDKVLIDSLIYEQKYNDIHLFYNLSGIIDEYWEILKYLTLGQALLFIKIIPVIEEVSSSLKLAAKVMGVVLNCPVSIKEKIKSVHDLDSRNKVPLGQWKLGINSVVGKTLRSDKPDLEITVGPVSVEIMKLFLPGKTCDLILKGLIDIIIPFDRNTIIKYMAEKSEKKFRLSNETHKAYLGINTTL
jgi:hypothetical protein